MPDLFNNLDAIQIILARSPFGLITDVDGTISEIAPSPALATVSPECREQLEILTAELKLVAAISGRPSIEVRDMVGVEKMVYVGNHGLERWQDGDTKLIDGIDSYRDVITEIRLALESLSDIDGIVIEDKGVAVAIHYRNCKDAASAREMILKRVTESDATGGFQIAEGKMVIELRPPVKVNKGTAVAELIKDYGLQGGLYMGDDISDLDAFRAMHKPGFCAIGVMSAETPNEVFCEADFTLNGIQEVARFLKWLAVTVPEPRS